MKSKDRVNEHGLGNFEVLSCIIRDRFYFAINNVVPPSSLNVHIFSIDEELIYENFYSDFGPFNLAQIYRYCRKVNKKLKTSSLSKNRIVHCASSEPKKRTNAAFLVGCYQIIYLNRSADDAYKCLLSEKYRTFLPYRDAAFGPSCYHLNLVNCLQAIQKAVHLRFLDFENFDLDDYEYNEKVENGDLSWILPKKFIAFSGPHSRTMLDNGYPLHAPEFYLPYFRKHNVSNVIRLNQKMYEASRFTRAGITHHDLFFPDGSVPTEAITRQFLEICENATGVIAVHCKAGLGRTGTLIGCYLMKHYRLTAAEAIAWIRICRPGSIIGRQQTWLEEHQVWCWDEGDAHKMRRRRQESPSPLLNRRRKDLPEASGAQIPRPPGKIIYVSSDIKPARREDASRLPAAEAGGEFSQPPVTATTSLPDEADEEGLPVILVNPNPDPPAGKARVRLNGDGKLVYHHKIQITGRSQSPPPLTTNDTDANDSDTAKEGTSNRAMLGMPISRSMDLPHKLNPSAAKSEFTQGDELNRIKLIRKRMTPRRVDESKNSSNLASSFPRVGSAEKFLRNPTGDICSVEGLDQRDKDTPNDASPDDGGATLDSADAVAHSRLYYRAQDSSSPPVLYRSPTITASPTLKAKDRGTRESSYVNGDAIDIRPSHLASTRENTGTNGLRTLPSANSHRFLLPQDPLPLPTSHQRSSQMGLPRSPPDTSHRLLRGRRPQLKGVEVLDVGETNGGSSSSGINHTPTATKSVLPSTLPLPAPRSPHQNVRLFPQMRPLQRLSINREGSGVLRASFPDDSALNTEAGGSSTAATRKRVDFVAPQVAASNTLPSKTRSVADNFYQRLNQNNNSNVTNHNSSDVDNKPFFLRPFRNFHDSDDLVGIKYNGQVLGRRNPRDRAASPAALSTPNLVYRHHVRSSSLKSPVSILNSPVVYAEVQTNPPPTFDHRPRASYRSSFNQH
uniref:protein-tyrosine-phosphatase n=2 Tax=Mesocestoides corti TaxID=53468 RepID=A0A5K3F4M3_MESCO